MSKQWLVIAPLAGAVGLGVGAGLGANYLLSPAAAAPEAAARQDLQPAINLPISRVVLFNSGVGYFSRSGEVVNDARVDLTFPEQDINDLLKSMVLEDFNGGRVAGVAYDSREPISRTLASFAVNLDGNPTFAGILQQMRGERVEVVVSPTAANQPGKLNGVIVGVEKQKQAKGNTTVDVEMLNLWCAEGLRSVAVPDVQQLRFLNPVIENEFRRALEVLSLSHDTQKKAVSLYFAGDGKRKVRVGYVIEAPIWKTSYRLLLADKEKPYLQGWAMVENPTDEDWAGVQVTLVSGRPISFKMDLYNPLFVDRPTVEPELFRSLRPVTYRGGIKQDGAIAADAPEADAKGLAAGAAPPAAPGAPGFGGRAAKGAAQAAADRGLRLAETADKATEDERRRFAQEVGRELGNRLATGAVASAATAGALGDFFHYVIDHPVTLGRQKSAMLPIVVKEIDGQKVSIYNERVLKAHPLLGLRFKNTSGTHLNQGPITVFEGSLYAGDTRILDVQPNEERLVSYAIDLATEVDPQVGPGTQRITSVKAVRGIITTKTLLTEEKRYRIVNRGQADRTLLIEHPNRTNQQFKLVDTDKPVEETAEVYRFQTPVKAGETKTFTVKEQRELASSIQLTNNADDQIRYFLNLAEASPALKDQLRKALEVKAQWDVVRRELAQVQADLQRLNADQDRIRKNLRETPRDAEVYNVYLKKLSDQEKEIDALTERQKKLMDQEFQARKRYDDFLANISD